MTARENYSRVASPRAKGLPTLLILWPSFKYFTFVVLRFQNYTFVFSFNFMPMVMNVYSTILNATVCVLPCHLSRNEIVPVCTITQTSQNTYTRALAHLEIKWSV